MAKYRVSIPFVAHYHVEVEAVDEAAAIDAVAVDCFTTAQGGIEPREHNATLSFSSDGVDYAKAEAEVVDE